MEYITIADRPPHHCTPQNGGFFSGAESPELLSDDPWQELTARHPELANLRQSPWATWGARKRRGSAAGHERPNTDFPNEPRSRFFREPFYENIPPEFREHIPNRWNQHFEDDNNQGHSQTLPRQEHHQEQPTQEHHPQYCTDKATQTLVDESEVDSSKPKQSLPQYGLRNTVDLGQKTAAEPGQLDAESARTQRSMSAPPDGRFSSPQRPVQVNNSNNANATSTGAAEQQTEQNSKQPAVRVIPIFVEGRDEPVINTKAETSANYAETTRPTPPKDDDFFTNHEMPHGFHPQSQFGRSYNSPFRSFGNRPSAFNQSKVFQQQPNQPPQHERPQQTHTFKSQTNIPNRNVHEEVHKPADVTDSKHTEQPRQQSPQPTPQQPPQQPTQQPPQQPSQQPQINDAISKIQLIQKDVLELMTQVENFSGKTKKDKDYIYLDEMLTRNLLKLDDIETEGKENIRLARKEAIKCIQKCIAVLEAKAESASVNENNHEASNNQNVEDMSQNESQPISTNNTQHQQKEKSRTPERMDTSEPKKFSKLFGKKKRDKSKDNKNGASVQNMDVDKVQEPSDNNNGATEAQTDTCTNSENGKAMEVDPITSSQ